MPCTIPLKACKCHLGLPCRGWQGRSTRAGPWSFQSTPCYTWTPTSVAEREKKAKAFAPDCIILNPLGIWVFVFLPRSFREGFPWLPPRPPPSRSHPRRWSFSSSCKGVSLGNGRQTLAVPLSEKSNLQNFIDIHRI